MTHIYKIYTDAIENKNWTDGADGWPVGTVAKLIAELESKFPEVEFEVVRNTTGIGAGYVGEDETLGREIDDARERLLSTM